MLEVQEPLIVDRSTLANYSECPAMGRFIESGEVFNRNRLMDIGNGIHDAFSATISQYLESGAAMGPSDIREIATNELYASRPDIQPEVISAAERMLWSWSRMIAECSPPAILRYDGGKGDKSGQLARDFEDLNVRVTSEIDFLTATASREVVEETDYKTGHKLHTAESVKADFQFQLHAWLIFDAYPSVKCVRIRVWNTRTNRLTYSVEFTRDDEPQFAARIRSAVTLWLANRNSIPELTETWPESHRCAWCPAAIKCPDANKDVKEVLANPEAAVDRLVSLESTVTELRKALTTAVKQRGADIVSANGQNLFGTEKPKQNRSQTMATYSKSKKGKESDDGTED